EERIRWSCILIDQEVKNRTESGQPLCDKLVEELTGPVSHLDEARSLGLGLSVSLAFGWHDGRVPGGDLSAGQGSSPNARSPQAYADSSTITFPRVDGLQAPGGLYSDVLGACVDKVNPLAETDATTTERQVESPSAASKPTVQEVASLSPPPQAEHADEPQDEAQVPP
ncbi:hypothetical protein FRC10_012321, partial [Ceratobasidium sp. 414]